MQNQTLDSNNRTGSMGKPRNDFICVADCMKHVIRYIGKYLGFLKRLLLPRNIMEAAVEWCDNATATFGCKETPVCLISTFAKQSRILTLLEGNNATLWLE